MNCGLMTSFRRSWLWNLFFCGLFDSGGRQGGLQRTRLVGVIASSSIYLSANSDFTAAAGRGAGPKKKDSGVVTIEMMTELDLSRVSFP